MITFSCPDCQHSLNAPPELRGRPFTCPHCGKGGVVPSAMVQSTQSVAQLPPPMFLPQLSASADKSAVLGPASAKFGGQLRQLLANLLFGVGITVVVYALLIGLGGTVPMAEKFTARGWTPYVAVLLTFWSLSMLVRKSLAVRKRHRSLDAEFLPRNAVLNTPQGIEEAIGFSRATSKRLKDVILGHRIRLALEHFKSTGNVKEAGDILSQESESDFAVMRSSYTMVRLFVWIIPILGFIGTVVGVSDAVGGFATFLTAAQEITEIKAALTKVTTGLSVAFDTTFVALVLSVVVMVVMSSVEKMEEDQLQLFEDYCQNRVLRRLPMQAADSGGARGAVLTEADLKTILTEIVPNAKIWQQEAHRLAETLSVSLGEAWKQVSQQWFGSLQALHKELAQHTARQAEMAAQMAQERASLEGTARNLLTQVKSLADSEQENLRKVLEVEQEAVTKAVQQQHNMVQTYVGALQRTGAKFGELVELQNKLESGLLQAAGSEGLAAMISDVRETLRKLDPAMERLANEPLKVKVSFVAGAVSADGA